VLDSPAGNCYERWFNALKEDQLLIFSLPAEFKPLLDARLQLTSLYQLLWKAGVKGTDGLTTTTDQRAEISAAY
jgi:hypothetical protein